MATRRRRSLPQVSPKIPSELRPIVSAMAEIIETGEGVRGDPLDRKLTLRDLVDGGIISVSGNLSPGSDPVITPGDGVPDLTVPPKPTNFHAVGGFNGTINLTWDIPGTLYSNHAYTNIYRAEEDNFANATLIGREAGAFFTDNVRDDVVIKTYYYWISFTSTSDVEGPLNDTAGTEAQALYDPDYIIGLLEGLLTESELADELLTPIQAIPTIETTLTDHDARLSAVQTAVNEVLNLPAFDSANNYDAGDTVKYNGYAWRALQAMTAPSPTPVEGAYWTQIGAYQTYDDLLSANAVAIADNETRITTAEGQISSISASFTGLQSDVADHDTELAGQAGAINSLETRVTANEGNITSISASITLLDNSLTTVEGDVSANSTALNLLDNRVTSVEGTVSSQAADITQLQADVQALDVDGNAAALQQLNARVDANEDDISAIASDITTITADVNGVSAALQTKAEVSAVQDLENDLATVSAQYTVKLDVNGRVAGIGLANDNGVSSFIVASDSVYFIDPGQSIQPFNPNTNYTSMTALRDTQLVFGYANVEGHRRFVINAPAYIPEGYIEKGQIGSVGFGSIVDDNGTPVTTVAGKLKAEHIDVDNLNVASAATFYGDAASGNFLSGTRGWKFWQNGNLEAYNATVRGRIEADSGYISQNLQIGGTSHDIADVVQMAEDAGDNNALIESWKKPGFTLIDGNKIYTGDAYVDTLQIKGQAVTFPRGAYTSGTTTHGNNSWKTIQSLSADLTGAPLILMASFAVSFSSVADSGEFAYLRARVVVGGSVAIDQDVLFANRAGSYGDDLPRFHVSGSPCLIRYYGSPGSGVKTISLQVAYWGSSSVAMDSRSLSVLEAKR